MRKHNDQSLRNTAISRLTSKSKFTFNPASPKSGITKHQQVSTVIPVFNTIGEITDIKVDTVNIEYPVEYQGGIATMNGMNFEL